MRRSKSVNAERYKVVQGSVSGHCCFEATVVDTHSFENGWYKRRICECFDPEDAHQICDLLNGFEEGEIDAQAREITD